MGRRAGGGARAALAALLLLLSLLLRVHAEPAQQSAQASAQQPSPRVLRIASANDPQTMDPHALTLLYQSRIVSQIYEGLVHRDRQFRIEPGLALSWAALDARTWRFKLRPGVRFHDGSVFDADDAVFSIERALKPQSQRAIQLRGVTGVRKVDALTIDVLLEAPDALLPERLWTLAMMSRRWCEQHQAQLPQDYGARQETFAVRNAMGTGPFKLLRYEADVRTSLGAHAQWWGRASHVGNLDGAQYLVIQSDAARLAALRSGQVDVVIDPPFQDIARLRREPGLKLLEAADMGTAYLGFDQHSAELPGGGVPGRNPFKDPRVRRAVYHALDMDLIVRQVLRGQAQATGSFLSPRVDGYLPALEGRLAHDPDAARALLAEAGYPGGFATRLDCVNLTFRQAVCQAMASMLGKVGIRASLQPAPPSLFFPKISEARIGMAEFGWSPNGDAWNMLQALVHSHDGKAAGAFNAGRYSNARLDALIDAIRIEPQLERRRVRIAEALRLLHAELPLLPLYRQVHVWALQPRVQAHPWPNSVLELRWVTM